MQLCWYRGSWYVREGRKRKSLGTRDRDEALRRLKDIEQARKDIGRSQGLGTVSSVIEAYLQDRSDRASIEKMKDAAKALRPIVGHLRPDQVDRATCRDYRKRRQASDGTKRKELGVLQAALRWSGRMVKLELPPMPAPREVFITKAQFEKLVSHAEAKHVKTFLYLAWYTAARKEALLSLPWENIDFDNRRIRLGAGVGRKGRAVVPIGKTLLAWLKDAYRSRTCEHVIEWGGKRVGNVRKGFDEAARRAKLGSITPHDLRRSAGRVMVEAGVPMEAVGQYLGHKNPAITYSTYARFAPNSKAFIKAAKALE